MLFGQLRLVFGGIPYTTGNKKLRELIALLLLCRGETVKKLWVAELLWPQAGQSQAMDSLYKVVRAWNRDEPLSAHLPLCSRPGELMLPLDGIESDIAAFERAIKTGATEALAHAVLLYTAPLLLQEYYEWTTTFDAYYDLRYLEALDTLIERYREAGDPFRANFFEKKRAQL